MSNDEFTRKAKEWDSNPERVRVADEFAAEVEKIADLNSQSEVLDFGCGTGLVGLRFSPQVKKLYMLDTSEAMLGMLQSKLAGGDFGNVEVVSVSLQDAKIPEDRLDAIFTSMAMHHVEDMPEVLASMKLILKKGGKLIIGELLPEDGSFHGENYVPYKGFEPEGLAGMLKEAGFTVVQHFELGLMKKADKDGVMHKYGRFVLEARKA